MFPEHQTESEWKHPALQEFIRLFNDRRFFEAHEVLEDLWVVSAGPARDFYKGLIQCAVAFTHLSRRNFKGARSLHRRAAGYLKKYRPRTAGVQVSRLLNDTEQFFQKVLPEMENDPSLQLPAVKTPQIVYNDTSD